MGCEQLVIPLSTLLLAWPAPFALLFSLCGTSSGPSEMTLKILKSLPASHPNTL